MIYAGDNPIGFSNTKFSGGTYYKCASVDTVNKTWTGYELLECKDFGIYATTTTSLSYIYEAPEIGVNYNADATAVFGIRLEDGLLMKALYNPDWEVDDEVTSWGDFDSVVSGKTAPTLVSADGKVGIKSTRGDGLVATGKKIIDDFTFAARVYVPSAASLGTVYSAPWLDSNTWLGAIVGLDENTNRLFSSKQGVSQVLCSSLHFSYEKTQTIMVAHSGTSLNTKFYVDGVLAETVSDSQTYIHSDNMYFLPGRTCGLVFFDLLAYNKALSAGEASQLHNVLINS